MSEFIRMFVYTYIAFVILGWSFWPEYMGEAHHKTYNSYMTGWSNVK